jgi:hypothetical protein
MLLRAQFDFGCELKGSYLRRMRIRLLLAGSNISARHLRCLNEIKGCRDLLSRWRTEGVTRESPQFVAEFGTPFEVDKELLKAVCS